MNDENKLQNEELEEVNGGSIDEETVRTCPSCGAIKYFQRDYPYGFFVRIDSNGCSDSITYYKCPECGYEWSE